MQGERGGEDYRNRANFYELDTLDRACRGSFNVSLDRVGDMRREISQSLDSQERIHQRNIICCLRTRSTKQRLHSRRRYWSRPNTIKRGARHSYRTPQAFLRKDHIVRTDPNAVPPGEILAYIALALLAIFSQ